MFLSLSLSLSLSQITPTRIKKINEVSCYQVWSKTTWVCYMILVPSPASVSGWRHAAKSFSVHSAKSGIWENPPVWMCWLEFYGFYWTSYRVPTADDSSSFHLSSFSGSKSSFYIGQSSAVVPERYRLER